MSVIAPPSGAGLRDVMWPASLTPEAAERPELYRLSRGTAHIVEGDRMSSRLLSQTAMGSEVCDHRYYKVVQETLGRDFSLRYILLHDKGGDFRGAQPFFVVQQNILAGVRGRVAEVADSIRSRYPAFLTLRTLMLGNPAGPGVLAVKAAATAGERAWFVGALAEALKLYSRQHSIRIVVFKDFPASDRAAMMRLTDSGAAEAGAAPADFVRLPSMPMTTLDLRGYASFEDYMGRTLSKITRKGLRRKFKRTAEEKIELTVTSDIEDCADEIHALYLQVYNRASLKFEKLTAEYLRALSREMPDRARFFLWRRAGKVVAASVTLVRFPEDGATEDLSAIYDLYLGMDYPLALDLSLYHLTMRDVVQWAIDHGIGRYVSTPLNYDSKLHFRHRLVPQDLYVRHTSPILNPAFQFAMRFAEPTRHDKVLSQFSNAGELRGG